MKVWKQTKRQYQFVTLSYWIKKGEDDWKQVVKRIVLRNQIRLDESNCFVTGMQLEFGKHPFTFGG